VILAYKLVRLIETHAEALATSLVSKVRESPRLTEYKKVPVEDLKGKVGEIYGHLGEWLSTHSEQDIDQRYTQIGAQRALQGVPLSQLNWTIVLTKENLWEFLRHGPVAADLREVSGELEMLQLLDQFFDRAIYFAAVGYERAHAGSAKAVAVASQ
jgi:hypothetical protein